jgi:catechol 2,3-dioxygenase-like lactoylglutathione lyase family enzyme
MDDAPSAGDQQDLSTGGVNPPNPVDAIDVDSRPTKGTARVVGINHVAMEVGDIEEALQFYGNIFSLALRGRSDGMAFVDLGDQFMALASTDVGRHSATDRAVPKAHIGLVVDDKDAVRQRLKALGIKTLSGPFLDFLDPWGNRVQVVAYSDVQFVKSREVLDAMGLSHLTKSQEAVDELRDKGVNIAADLIVPHAKT